MLFSNRQDAGQQLAQALKKYQNAPETIILALPRGGVVVGAEAARTLNLPLDIVVPRKIGAPNNPEYAIGAITETGEGIFNEQEKEKVNKNWLKQEIEKEKQEARRRLKHYRGDRPSLNLPGQTVIIIDDGLATGLTMKAALAAVKKQKPAKIVVAVPVAAADSAREIQKEADEFVCLHTPIFFNAVGAFYTDFKQTTDKEVIHLLNYVPSSSQSFCES